MKLLNILVLCFIFFLASCKTQPLESRWHPLKAIVQTNNLPFVGENTTITISPYLYTENLERWMERNPVGSVHYEALMRHEHKHALSQENYPSGKKSWLLRYGTDRNFRWQEEKLGYREAIRYYRSKGYRVNPEGYAKILSGPTYQNMVSYEEALNWVNSILKGE